MWHNGFLWLLFLSYFSLRSGQFKGSKKSWPPQKVPWNGSKSDSPAKKIMSRIFLNSGTLIVIFCCILSTLWSQAAFHKLPHFSRRFQKSRIKCRGFLLFIPLRRFTLYFLSRSFARNITNGLFFILPLVIYCPKI